jgi:asparagine synthase (glutamine-hydrolysing)
MCGICGIATPAGSGRRLEESLLVRMRDTMTHRGPDDAGLFLAPEVGLGHRRLSIVDVARGHQPMASSDGRLTMVYNGEVYNHPALQSELEGQGVVYRTHCDTETVLHLYERHGPDCVRHLRGMFALAIWDRARHELFLARDRFGVKPLYYVHDADGTLWFASEIKALLEAGAVRPALNRLMLPDFLANHAPSGDDTLFAGVRRLPPGHTLTWQNGAVSIRSYWEMPCGSTEQSDPRRDPDLVAEYLERFTEAVRLRLMADVPLGMFLSGGIDSAAITAVMSGLVREPVKTFSVAFAEREANELSYARMVADRYRTDHHEVVVTPEAFFQAVPKLVWHEDEPMAHPSSVALYFVSRLAAEHVKVVLTGEGSDETLAGYNRYRLTVLNSRLGSLLPGALRSVTRGGIGLLPRQSGWRRKLERTFLALPPDLDALYFDNFAVFGRGAQHRFLSPALRAELAGVNPYAAFHAALARVPDAALLDRLLYADTRTYLHELLMKQDQMSMAASIESRVPFLDHPLAEFAARLPARLKLDGFTTKAVLRRAMKGLLPEPILSRKKMGFPVPVGPWLRGPWSGLLDDLVTGERALARGLFDPAAVRTLVAAHRNGQAGCSERLWALLTLEVWQRIFLDREPAEAVLPAGRATSSRAA